MSLTRKDSRIIWVETIYTAVKNHANQTQLVIGVVRQLTGAESIAAASGVDWPPAQQHEGAPGDPSPIPGNELIEFTADDSTAASARSLRLDQQLERFERNVIVRALASAGGQRNRAAELMGISRSRLYRRMEALGIKPDELP
ncbi:MAG: hypothetical protein KF841_06270 [Phycisphaerae bacterium]|nr:hypothetical protein [Phycisphaerae bacterium]